MTLPLPANWADAGTSYDATNQNNVETIINNMGRAAALTAATAVPSATQVVLASLSCPANSMAVGTSYNIRAQGVQSTTSGSLTWELHIGTLGTSADTTVATAVAPTAASGGCMFDGELTIRTTGASGTCMASCTGIGSAAVNSTQVAAITVSTTVANFVTVTLGAGAGSHTVQTATVSVVKS